MILHEKQKYFLDATISTVRSSIDKTKTTIKMKPSVYCLFILLFFITSCQKDDFIYEYPETDKLLISISRTYREQESITEFKYDSLNQISEILELLNGEQVRQESFAYNNKLQLIKKVDDWSTCTYSYDSKGRLATKELHQKLEDGKSEWDVLTEFEYKSGRLVRGVVHYPYSEFSSAPQINTNINYKYDSNGNVVEILGSGDIYEYKYDSKINPLAKYGIVSDYGYSIRYTLQPEMVQINNPVYAYSEIKVMSRMPPRYEIAYAYNQDDLPIKAELNDIDWLEGGTATLEFQYRSKN